MSAISNSARSLPTTPAGYALPPLVSKLEGAGPVQGSPPIARHLWGAQSRQQGAQVEDDRQARDADRQLEAAEAKYRALVEQIPAIVYTAEFGADGRWSYVSPRIESILGYSSEEWMANPSLWYERLHSEDRDEAMAQERAARETKRFLA